MSVLTIIEVALVAFVGAMLVVRVIGIVRRAAGRSRYRG